MQDKTNDPRKSFIKLSFTLDKVSNKQLMDLMWEDERTRSSELRMLIKSEYIRRHPDVPKK